MARSDSVLGKGCWFSEQELNNLGFIATTSSPSSILWVISGRDFIATLCLGLSQGKVGVVSMAESGVHALLKQLSTST